MATPVIDETGHRYGRLTVIQRADMKGRHGLFWRCQCDCGAIAVVHGGNLRRGDTKSCGCLHLEGVRRRWTTHGEARSSEYRAWADMKTRCFNSRAPEWQWYGARGITVCERWRESFANFLEDMGRCPSKHSLDRVDVNGSYEKQNCRWASTAEQALNKRHHRYWTLEDERISVKQMAEILAINRHTLKGLLQKLERSL